jgi:hypothetical protein
MFPDEYDSDLLVVCYGQNSLQTGKNLFSHFTAQVYKLFDVLAKIIMVHTNCTSSETTVLETDDSDFGMPEQFYICRDIMHRNLGGDSDVRVLTPVLFTSKTSHNGLDNPLHRPVEQSFIQHISVPQVTEYGEDVAFNNSVFRTSRYHAFKRDTFKEFRHCGSLEGILY